MLVSDGGGHGGGDACLDVNHNQLGIEVFSGEGWRTNRGTKEAEMSGEFGGEWRAQDINIVHFGRLEIGVVSEGLMYHNIVQYVESTHSTITIICPQITFSNVLT